jgi:hypothetical protein
MHRMSERDSATCAWTDLWRTFPDKGLVTSQYIEGQSARKKQQPGISGRESSRPETRRVLKEKTTQTIRASKSVNVRSLCCSWYK